jgi:hypothetical protein
MSSPCQGSSGDLFLKPRNLRSTEIALFATRIPDADYNLNSGTRRFSCSASIRAITST